MSRRGMKFKHREKRREKIRLERLTDEWLDAVSVKMHQAMGYDPARRMFRLVMNDKTGG